MSLFKTESWQRCEAELRRRYSSQGRHYHTLQHIRNCLSKLDSVSHCHNREALKLAIWFHDAIYDPLRTDNEEASAELADEWLASIDASSQLREDVAGLIIATDHKTAPANDDEKLIVDIDLSILGSSEIDYVRYAGNIRKEYAAFSDKDYTEGRKKVLRHFLDKPALYSIPLFSERFEAPARRNLERELKSLAQSEEPP
ncbi:MAG: hypothetical protein P1U86_09155 [Verrucomicrobiales bacterium]|nr:hypothetical protein [Verrucomicrobiales bacterium]